jgi:ZIP family zinc transporter
MIAWVFGAALATALATGLGAVPLLLARRGRRSWLGAGNAVAAGMMAAATVGLLYEGCRSSVLRTLLGVALGLVFMAAMSKLIARHDHPRIGPLRGADALKGLTIVGVMTVHSFAEGIGVGVSFGSGGAFGLLIAVAIAVHNIPEGLAVSLVLVPRGTRVLHAAGWSVFTSLPQPLLAVPAFLFVESFRGLLPIGLGFAGGAMIWIVATQLLPDAAAEAPRRTVSAWAGLSAAAMLAAQALLFWL